VRTRVLFALVAIGGLAVTVAVIAALSVGTHAGSSSGFVTVDVSGLRPGDVLTTGYTVSVANLKAAPVFITDTPNEGVVALVGRSTHLGCRVAWVHAAGYRRFETHPQVVFEDPCGGSLFALNGECLGGPCPRGLDRLATTRTRSVLRINLREITRGPPREAAQLSS
jgi:Rieske Fe-S protein